jgi:predicted alpha/beta superfamily hydrolase
MIVSPSFWWDNESLLTIAPGLLANQPDKKIKVYISVGKEGKQMEDDARQFAEILHAADRSNLQLHFLPLSNETHLTILHNSVYKGFEILYPKKTGKKE